MFDHPRITILYALLTLLLLVVSTKGRDDVVGPAMVLAVMVFITADLLARVVAI